MRACTAQSHVKLALLRPCTPCTWKCSCVSATSNTAACRRMRVWYGRLTVPAASSRCSVRLHQAPLKPPTWSCCAAHTLRCVARFGHSACLPPWATYFSNTQRGSIALGVADSQTVVGWQRAVAADCCGPMILTQLHGNSATRVADGLRHDQNWQCAAIVQATAAVPCCCSLSWPAFTTSGPCTPHARERKCGVQDEMFQCLLSAQIFTIRLLPVTLLLCAQEVVSAEPAEESWTREVKPIDTAKLAQREAKSVVVHFRSARADAAHVHCSAPRAIQARCSLMLPLMCGRASRLHLAMSCSRFVLP